MSIEQWSSEIQSFISGLENLKSKHEQVLETNSKLASTIQEQHTLIDDLKHSVFVERHTSANYARLLTTAKEKNNQLLVENAELEKRIEELE
jgi:hypothetical protein